MNLLIRSTICFILFLAITVILFFFIRIIRQCNERKRQFIAYLESNGDYQNLVKFGFYNAGGFKESRRVPFLDRLIFEEYESSHDKVLLDYSLFIRRKSRWLILLYFSAFFLFGCLMTIIGTL